MRGAWQFVTAGRYPFGNARAEHLFRVRSTRSSALGRAAGTIGDFAFQAESLIAGVEAMLNGFGRANQTGFWRDQRRLETLGA